ncbi:MAG TPA: GGDEF domain-containing protein [Patescibacteria group bacterium]|nr:GGDEF domain-containing protein [Patescibacteria group bacterium]
MSDSPSSTEENAIQIPKDPKVGEKWFKNLQDAEKLKGTNGEPIPFQARHQVALDRAADQLEAEDERRKKEIAIEIAAEAEIEASAQRERAERGEVDELTGLMTRAAFMRKLEERAEDTHRSGVETVVVVGDVNDLKIENDTNGHTAGDKLMSDTGNAILKTLREVDSAGRIGGDEIAIILYDTTPEEALVVLKRLQENFAKARNNNESAIKVSMGVASLEPNPANSLKNADEAMYISKYNSKIHSTKPEPVLFNTVSEEQLHNIDTIKKIANVRQQDTKAS